MPLPPSVNDKALPPIQPLVVPVIGESGFTVTDVVVKHDPDKEYVTVALPALPPVITPSVPILAIVPSLLLQVPPVVPSLRAVVNPWHTVGVPLIAGGVGFMVTERFAVVGHAPFVAVMV